MIVLDGLDKIIEMSLFWIFLNATANAASMFSKIKFLDCLHRFFDGYVTFHCFHKLKETFILTFDFEKLSS